MDGTTLLYKIIKGSTVTWTVHICYIDRYKSSWEIIDTNFIEYLIYMDILEEESGNFETGERHYILSDKLFYFKNKVKYILN